MSEPNILGGKRNLVYALSTINISDIPEINAYSTQIIWDSEDLNTPPKSYKPDELNSLQQFIQGRSYSFLANTDMTISSLYKPDFPFTAPVLVGENGGTVFIPE